MSEKEPQISKKAEEVRNYLMGDTGLGQEESLYGPARITQIAGRRRSFLAQEEHNSAWEAVRVLRSNPGKETTELMNRAEAACARVMGRTGDICREAGLSDHAAEVYIAAVQQGCNRLQIGVRETLADSEGGHFDDVLDHVESIATSTQRWHEVREDDPDVRRRP
jgi:hypothetical protein